MLPSMSTAGAPSQGSRNTTSQTSSVTGRVARTLNHPGALLPTNMLGVGSINQPLSTLVNNATTNYAAINASGINQLQHQQPLPMTTAPAAPISVVALLTKVESGWFILPTPSMLVGRSAPG